MNDDIRRSWQAANRFDAARLPLPWRVEWDDGVRFDREPAFVVLDAEGREVCLVQTSPDIPAWHAGFKALAECIAALPELLGEYKPEVPTSRRYLVQSPVGPLMLCPDPGAATWGDVQSPPVKP